MPRKNPVMLFRADVIWAAAETAPPYPSMARSAHHAGAGAGPEPPPVRSSGGRDELRLLPSPNWSDFQPAEVSDFGPALTVLRAVIQRVPRGRSRRRRDSSVDRTAE